MNATPDRVPQQVRVVDGEVVTGHACGRAVGVGLRDPDELGHEAMELVVGMGPARRHGGQAPAMVSVVQGQGVGGARPVLRRDLQGHLHGETPVEAVANPVQSAGRQLRDSIRKEQQRNGVVVASSVRNRFGLGGRGCEDVGVAGADVVRPGLRRAVDVFVAIGVPDPSPLGSHEEQVCFARDRRRPAAKQCPTPPIERFLVGTR